MRTELTEQVRKAELTFPTHSSEFGPEIYSSSSAESLATNTSSQFSEETRNELVLAHLPLVRFVARRIYERVPQHVEFDDLVAAGLLGLIDAASRFDSNKQVQFKSYAQFRVRGAILDSLRTVDWSPRDLRRKGREMAEAIRALSARFARTPTDVEIAEEMGLPLEEVQQVSGDLKGLEIGSLYSLRADEDGEEEVETISAPADESPLALCIAGQTREQLIAAIELLPEKERLVLTLSYYEELTLKEIGLVLGVVESRVCQIRSAAVARLRKLMGKRPEPSGTRPQGKRMN